MSTIDVKPNSELHKRIITGVRARQRASRDALQARHTKWRQAEEAALAYLPERAVDAKRRVVREAGKPQYTTIQIPYSYAVLMASHTYWTTVFLSRTPILQYTSRHGEGQQQVLALEALIDYQVQVGQMLVPLYVWLADGGKYGLGVIGQFWEEKFSNIAQIVEEEEEGPFAFLRPGRKKKRKITQRVRGYVGNRIYNVRPFDFFPDPRVPIQRFQDGEFCAVYNELGWNSVLRRAEQGIYTNIDRIPRASITSAREEGSAQLVLPGTNLSNIFDRRPKDVIKFYEMVIELIPDDWGLGKSRSPEKWVFTVISDFTLVIGAQPLGLLHDKFPYHVIEFEPEGYALASRGIPEILEPVQNTMDFLINAHFYNVRKTLNNQFVVDPSRVVMKDILDPEPGGVFRLKPAAYGTDPKLALSQMQITDVTQNHMRDLREVLSIGERVIGVNDQIFGLISKGGRKSATEVRTSSAFAINRLKTVSEYFSAMGWAPMAQMLVQNSQQLYDTEMKFRIAGNLVGEAGPQFIDVTPESIQGFYDFVPVDGTLPIDRFAQANLWRELMAQMEKSPQLMQQFDLGRIFMWVAQLAGLKNVDQFRIQAQPDETLALQAERGNVVPMPAATRDLTRVPEPGQVPGMGTTG